MTWRNGRLANAIVLLRRKNHAWFVTWATRNCLELNGAGHCMPRSTRVYL